MKKVFLLCLTVFCFEISQAAFLKDVHCVVVQPNEIVVEYELGVQAVCADGISDICVPVYEPIERNEECNPPTNLTATKWGTNINLTWTVPGYGDTLLQEDFSTVENAGIPIGWTIIDNDGDGHNWYGLNNTGSPIIQGHSGSSLMTSASYIEQALTPDNFLITPMVENAISVNYWISAQDASWAAEHYAVMASSTGTAVADFSIVFEETIGAKSGRYSEERGIMTQGTWYERTVDLPVGTKYIAFRHYNCTDMFRLNLDDVTVIGGLNNLLMPAYKVYRGTTEIATVNTTSYTDEGLEPGNYCYTVKTVCESGLSDASNEACAEIPIPSTCNPPTNVQAVALGLNASITWDEVINENELHLSHSGEYNEMGVGTGSSADFSCAHKWTAAELTDYVGWTLTEIAFVPVENPSAVNFSIRAWSGTGATPSTMVLDQPVPSFTPASWNEVAVGTPVTITANTNFWFGYRVVTTTGHPAGVDAGPALVGQGDLMYFNAQWTTLSNLGNDINWCIIATVENFRGETANLVLNGEMGNSTGTLSLSSPENNTKLVSKAPSRNSGLRDYTYNVYRDGSLIAEHVSANSYFDTDLTSGEHYCYTIKTVCGNGISENSEERCIDIINNCVPPNNVTAAVNNDDVTVAWTASANSQQWVAYSGELSAFYGIIPANSHSYAMRINMNDAALISGKQITKVRLGLGVSLTTYAVRIWTGSPNNLTLVYEQAIPNMTEDNWNEIELTTPYTIPAGTEVWIGYTAGSVEGSTYCWGVDSGPLVPNTSYIINASGATVNVGSIGLPYNLCIRAFITGEEVTYNLYRNNQQIAENLDVLTYTDEDLTDGEYCYTLTTNCSSEESGHSVQACTTMCQTIQTDFIEIACDSYNWNSETYTQSGNYQQIFDAANGCDSVVTLHLIVNELPDVQIEGTTEITIGESVTLTASGAVSYLWSTGETTAEITVTPSDTTTYSVVGTDENGCENAAEHTVNVNNVGISEVDAALFKIFPNPTNGLVNIEGENISRIEMYNSVGQLVVSRKIDEKSVSTIQLETKQFESGTYLIRIVTCNGNIVSKHIVIAH